MTRSIILQATLSEFTKFAFIANTISFMSLQTSPVYASLMIIQEQAKFSEEGPQIIFVFFSDSEFW